MKKIFSLFINILLVFLFSSCATLIGGGKYYANVRVDDRDAKIYHKGSYQGTGNAIILTRRADANKFSIKVDKKGCKEQDFEFTKRTFRGWAFLGTVVGWTGLYQGIPLPWGILVDLASGSLWKPDIQEYGVSQKDMKNFIYNIEYTGCEQEVSLEE